MMQGQYHVSIPYRKLEKQHCITRYFVAWGVSIPYRKLEKGNIGICSYHGGLCFHPL